jgi:hypothetical protein
VNLSARAVTNGVLSPPSEVRTYNVDASAPMLTVLNPATEIGILAPSEAIGGTARDVANAFESKIARVEIHYIDLSGLSDPTTDVAFCGACPDRVVSWQRTPSVRPGLYGVTVTAFDRAGNSASRAYTLVIV